MPKPRNTIQVILPPDLFEAVLTAHAKLGKPKSTIVAEMAAAGAVEVLERYISDAARRQAGKEEN